MRLGLTLTGDQVTMADMVHFARQAEEAGFDSVWVAEAWREAFVPLTAIALTMANLAKTSFTLVRK